MPGDPGPAGAPGAAATVDVGTTTTLPPGSLAEVTNSGTSGAAVFNFSIPQGEQGIDGLPGDPGPAGAPGAAATIAVGTTTTLPPGSSATVTNSGTSGAAVFDFAIPEGQPGSGGGGSSGFEQTFLLMGA